jgi:hypothetical protein
LRATRRQQQVAADHPAGVAANRGGLIEKIRLWQFSFSCIDQKLKTMQS